MAENTNTHVEVAVLESGNVELSFTLAGDDLPSLLFVQSPEQAGDLIDKLREAVNRRVETVW